MRKCFHDGADLLAAARPAAHRLDRLREQGLRVHEEGGANAGTGSEGYGFASSEVAAAVLRAEAAHFRRARRRLLLRRKPLLQPPPPALGTHKCYNAAAVVNFVGGSGSGVMKALFNWHGPPLPFRSLFWVFFRFNFREARWCSTAAAVCVLLLSLVLLFISFEP